MKIKNYSLHLSWIFFVSAVLVGIIARFCDLTLHSYWLDELYSVRDSNPLFSYGEVINFSRADVHPPLYQIILWLWYKIAGVSELTGRLLSAIFGVLGIASVYFLGKEAFNSKVGACASALTALNFFHLYYSQEVRSYALLFCFASLSSACFLRAIKTPKIRSAVTYSLITLALLYTHFFGFFLLFSQLVFFLGLVVFKKGTKKNLMVPSIIATIIIIVGILPQMRHILQNLALDSFWIPAPSPDFFIEYFLEYFADKYIAIVCFLLLLASSFLSATYAKRNRVEIFYLLSIVIFPVLFAYIRSIVSVPMLHSKQTIAILPSLMVLIGYALVKLEDKFSAFRIVVPLTICFFGYSLFFRIDYYGSGQKEDFRVLAQSVIQDPHPAYTRRKLVSVLNEYIKMLGHSYRVNNIENLNLASSDPQVPDTFWILNSHNIAFNTVAKPRGMKVVQTKEGHDAEAVLFTKK